MASTLTIAAVEQAFAARDPQFVRLLSQLAAQPDPTPETPIRDGAPTFDSYLAYLRSYEFKRKAKAEQRAARMERLAAVESPTAEVPLPERLKSHQVLTMLWQSPDPLARDALLRVIAEIPLVYGPWRALKSIFKDAQSRNDTEVWGALAARFDTPGNRSGTVSGATLGYLNRRVWRYLRRVAVQLPASYADVAVDVLLRYPEGATPQGTWVMNHIFFHDSKQYGRGGFHFGYRNAPTPSELKFRAYTELWKRSPRPLFTLLERAQSDAVREFAAAGLKADFRAVLRDVEPGWVARLTGVRSAAVHDFVVWILQNVPKFEQGEFRTLALHAPVLRLLDSPSAGAAKYAADYARTHARDLGVDELVRLFASPHEPVRKLARDLLGERDPRTGVGLDAWGRLLETPNGNAFAAEVLVKAFGPRELTPAWFADRLLSPSDSARKFARAQLPKVHPPKTLGPGFYVELVKRVDPADYQQAQTAQWAMTELGKFDLSAFTADDLRLLLLFPPTGPAMMALLKSGKLRPQVLGLDFLKSLAYRPDFESSTWLATFRANSGAWAKDLDFSEDRARELLTLFADVRQFTTAELGLDWMLSLAGRPEPLYHDFARDRLVRTASPADFATAQAAVPPTSTAAAPAAADLQRKSFLFTGKLSTMTRDEAEAKVKSANGTVAGSVTNKLAYLVVGDDGSPLYGAGKKGSKQVKAEQLNEAGANIAIVSETAFLQMASGTAPASTAVDTNATAAGFDRLWGMATAPGAADAPLAAFARDYLKKHHVPLAQELLGKPPDPGTEVPAALLDWPHFRPLFAETRKPLRDFALAFSAHDFARWSPPADDLLTLSENPFVDVRRFVAKALLAGTAKDERGYRIDPTTLDAAAVYRFCESGDEETRALGLELIRRQPRLRVPGELFRLTESPDRKVRAFVIRSLWHVYRDAGLTAGWAPPVPPAPTVGAKAIRDAEKRAAERGAGVPPHPEVPPAGQVTLAQFLRRVLFELPPGPPEKSRTGAEQPGDSDADDGPRVKRQVDLKPIPARRAKRDAVETMRDLALEDPAFAAGILPLLDEFLHSVGSGERAACLVAVTRIRHRYPEPARPATTLAGAN